MKRRKLALTRRPCNRRAGGTRPRLALFPVSKRGGHRVDWWVAYQRGSFRLKERYSSARHAQERCGRLFTHAQHLRVIAGDDIEACATLAHWLELPPATQG